MKFSFMVLSTAFFMASCFFSDTSSSGVNHDTESKNIKKINPSKNVAVIELFTSQGCSSCPPADALMGKYVSQPNVLVLSFHVDYWDRLGWKDPFSKKEFTRRQYDYAQVLGGGVYTPEAVINGQAQVVGSEASKINRLIQGITSSDAPVSLSVSHVSIVKGLLDLTFDVLGNAGNNIIHAAIIDKEATTQIKRGENSGLKLTNYNVVRYLSAGGVAKEGINHLQLKIPDGIVSDQSAVIIFLQNEKDRHIIAGVQSDI